MARVQIKQVRSSIGRPGDQRATLEALGLRKINQVVEHEGNAQIMGMIRKVNHLITVQEVK